MEALAPLAIDPVAFDRDGEIAYLTLNNPGKRNALSHAMLQALRDRIREVDESKGVRAVILRSRGAVFSAGHDLRELAESSAERLAAIFALCSDAMLALQNLRQPVVAQVHGLATAAGCQLVASCDLAIAAEEATFAAPGVKVGLFCTTPGIALRQSLSAKKTLEMLYTGEAIDAREAERCGLINRVVPGGRLAEETRAYVERILRVGSDVLTIGKRAFYAYRNRPIAEEYREAEKIMVENAALPNAREGFSAFLEKRPPRWTN